MKYFRYYPWGLQLLLFFLMVFTLLSFSVGCLTILAPKVWGATMTQIQLINEHTPYQLVKISQTVQGILSVCMFVLPCLLFAYLTHPDPRGYLGLKMPGKPIHFILVIVMMLGAIPVLEGIEALISQINFGESVRKSQEESNSMMQAYLTMPTFSDFVRTFFIMAIIPAFGEELFFRGLLMKFTAKRSKNIWVAILFTAVLFAFAHSNIYGMLSIFFAGVLLAGIYYLTGSLWCSMVAHMCFNGSQVVLTYMGNTNAAIKNFENSNTVRWWLVAAGAAVFATSFYLLWKNRTPLKPDWTNDFDAPASVLADGDHAQ